jgi:hypothetical protein
LNCCFVLRNSATHTFIHLFNSLMFTCCILDANCIKKSVVYITRIGMTNGDSIHGLIFQCSKAYERQLCKCL